MFSKILRKVKNIAESFVEIGKSLIEIGESFIDIVDGLSKIKRIWSRKSLLA